MAKIIDFEKKRLEMAIRDFVEEHREDYAAFMAAAMAFGEHIKNCDDPFVRPKTPE